MQTLQQNASTLVNLHNYLIDLVTLTYQSLHGQENSEEVTGNIMLQK